MSKPNPSMQSTVFCGIDVSAATLAAAVHQEDQRFEQRVFNIPAPKPTLEINPDHEIVRKLLACSDMPSLGTQHGCFLTRLCSWKRCRCGNPPPSFNVSTAY
jgi:hypothetical protein